MGLKDCNKRGDLFGWRCDMTSPGQHTIDSRHSLDPRPGMTGRTWPKSRSDRTHHDSTVQAKRPRTDSLVSACLGSCAAAAESQQKVMRLVPIFPQNLLLML